MIWPVYRPPYARMHNHFLKRKREVGGREGEGKDTRESEEVSSLCHSLCHFFPRLHVPLAVGSVDLAVGATEGPG